MTKGDVLCLFYELSIKFVFKNRQNPDLQGDKSDLEKAVFSAFRNSFFHRVKLKKGLSHLGVNDAFRSKSVRPTVLFSLKIR